MNIFLPFSFLFFFREVKNQKTGFGGCAAGCSADHQKGKLCTAGRKIIALPQVKNIVALLKSACKASYVIRMFKY